jgi:hypothetical protein
VPVVEYGSGDMTLILTALEIAPGPYIWRVTAPGYTASTPTGSGVAPGTSTVLVRFTPSSTSTAGPFDWLWAVVGAVAAVAALGFALFALERRKGRRRPPPAPMAPAAVVAPPSPSAKPTPWQESGNEQEPTPANPPWEESPGDAEQPQAYARRP